MRVAQAAVLAISLLGMVVSGLGLSVTYLGAERLERPAKAFIQWQIERELREAFSIEAPAAEEGGVLAAARRSLAARIDAAEVALGSGIADVIAERITTICVCRLRQHDRDEIAERFEAAKANTRIFVEAAMRGSIERDRIGLSTLKDLIAGHYVDTVDGLIQDLRIFFGANLVLFAVIGVAGLLSASAPPLLLPAGLLSVSTLGSASLYLFAQNWFYTILFGSYVGWAYLVWVGLIMALLVDITMNRARVTFAILDAIQGVVEFFKCLRIAAD